MKLMKTDLCSFGSWPVKDDTLFPKGFFDIGGKTFEWVFDNRKEFVEYIREITNATGLWKSFQDYILSRL